MVSRRRFIAASALMGSLAGCSFDGPKDDTADVRQTSDRTQTPSTPPTRTAPSGTELPPNLDIRDFGAAVDGGVVDTGAIQDAIEAANAGDNILFPRGTTLVSGRNNPDDAGINIAGDSIPKDLTLVGRGYDSVIRIDGAQPRYHKVINIKVQDGIEGLTIRNLRIDGNKSGQTQSLGSGGHAIVSNDAVSDEAPVDVLIQNVWVENSNSSGISPHHGGFTLDRVTVRNCAKHGMSPDSASDVQKYDPPIVIRNSLCVGNGKEGVGPTYGIDCSGGKILVEDTVCEGNAQGTKTTEQGIEITYRRVRLKDNEIFGYIRAGGQRDDRTLVTFEDVVSEGNGASGFRFSKDTEYRIPTEIVATNNGNDNVWLANDTLVTGKTIWSNRARNAYGLTVQQPARGQIENYYPYQNDRGAIQTQGGLVIGERESRDKTDISGVPYAYQVGAGSVPNGRRVRL